MQDLSVNLFGYITTLKIDFSNISNFLLGMLTGIILLFLFFVFIMASDERKKSRRRLKNQIPLENKVVEQMIIAKQEKLYETVRLTDNAYFKVAFDLSFELGQEIARYYYPDSKFPIYELSVQDILDLNYYITKRLEEIVNSRFIRKFKHTRIVKVVNALNARKKIDNSKLMKISRKLKFQTLYTIGKAALSYANPVFWFRKLAIKPSTVLVTREVCKTIIQIFGEETNKVYSKSLFMVDESQEEVNAAIDTIIDSDGEE